MNLKKLLALLLCLTFCGAAIAEIIPAEGMVQSFYDFSGIAATWAVVLCETLTGRAEPDYGAKDVITFRAGETFLTWQRKGDWINAYYSDGGEPVWVRSEYILTDPAFYITEKSTPAYAQQSLSGVRVGLLPEDTKLPIIAEEDGALLVSLRGAAAWVAAPARTKSFTPKVLGSITAAKLEYTDPRTKAFTTRTLTDPAELKTLSELLCSTEDATATKCPFGFAYLTVTTPETSCTLDLAVDDCCIYTIDDTYYRYACHLFSAEGSPKSTVLFDLFEVERME